MDFQQLLWQYHNYFTVSRSNINLSNRNATTQRLCSRFQCICVHFSELLWFHILVNRRRCCLFESKKNMSNDPTHSIDAKFHNSGLWIFCNNRRFMSLCWVWQEIAYPELWKSFWMTTTMSTMASVHFDFQPKHPSNKFCNNNLWIFYANK